MSGGDGGDNGMAGECLDVADMRGGAMPIQSFSRVLMGSRQWYSGQSCAARGVESPAGPKQLDGRWALCSFANRPRVSSMPRML